MSSRRVSRQRQSAVGATDVLIMLQRMIDAKEREVAMLRDLLAEIHHPAPAAAYHHRPAPMVHSRASTFMTSTCRRCSGQAPPPKSGSSTSSTSARSTPSVASVRRSTPSVASSRGGRSVRSLDV